MAGVSTNVCVESTARDGFMRDYHILFLSDCTAAFSLEEHLMTLKNIDNFFGMVCSSMDLMAFQSKRRLAVDIDELKKEKVVRHVTM
jgi:nicotinamidase-related amidase